MPDENILITVRGAVPTLRPAERRVADAVLADPGRAAESSITALAKKCRTSETTVLRFCRVLGLKGYPQLRIAMARAAQTEAIERGEAMVLTGEVDQDDTVDQVISKILHADARSIDDTAAVLNADVLGECVRAILAAGRINVYGVGASSVVAEDLCEKLQRIGLVSFMTADPHRALANAAILSPGDVFIAISHSGTTTDTVDVTDEAKARGATTVAVTNHPDSALGRGVDHVLQTAARETTFRSGAMASRIAQLAVVDCLYACVTQQRYDEAVTALDSTFDAVRTRHVATPRKEEA